MRKVVLLTGMLLAISSVAAACGDGGDGDATPPEASPSPTAGTSPTPSGTLTPEPSATTGIGDGQGGEAQVVFMEVAVYDDTVDRPIKFGAPEPGETHDRVEVWIKEFGPWYPDLGGKADLNTLGTYPAGEEHELFIYPDGRDGGPEIRVTFQATADVIPNRVVIRVSDSSVIVTGPAIPESRQEFQRQA